MDEHISYDSEDLIHEVECDILEFGEFAPVAVWQKEMAGKFFCINYDFVACDEVNPDEIGEGEILIPMTLRELLTALKSQNPLF